MTLGWRFIRDELWAAAKENWSWLVCGVLCLLTRDWLAALAAFSCPLTWMVGCWAGERRQHALRIEELRADGEWLRKMRILGGRWPGDLDYEKAKPLPNKGAAS